MEDLDYIDLSNRIKLLAHPERLRILNALRRDAECVCHLETLLGKPQPYVSQQLRILRDAGVIADEKQGQNVFYRLRDHEFARWLEAILGNISGSEANGTQHQMIDNCVCPKCRPDAEATLLPARAEIELL